MIPCIYVSSAACFVDSDAAQECLAAAPHLITGSLPDLKHYGARCTCLPAVSTSQTSIKTSSAGWARETERRSQRDARTSHPSHHKKFSSQGYGPSFREDTERVKDESLSGSNNKEGLSYTSFLNLSPSVALASFKSLKSSPTWPMASDPSF